MDQEEKSARMDLYSKKGIAFGLQGEKLASFVRDCIKRDERAKERARQREEEDKEDKERARQREERDKEDKERAIIRQRDEKEKEREKEREEKERERREKDRQTRLRLKEIELEMERLNYWLRNNVEKNDLGSNLGVWRPKLQSTVLRLWQNAEPPCRENTQNSDVLHRMKEVVSSELNNKLKVEIDNSELCQAMAEGEREKELSQPVNEKSDGGDGIEKNIEHVNLSDQGEIASTKSDEQQGSVADSGDANKDKTAKADEIGAGVSAVQVSEECDGTKKDETVCDDKPNVTESDPNEKAVVSTGSGEDLKEKDLQENYSDVAEKIVETVNETAKDQKLMEVDKVQIDTVKTEKVEVKDMMLQEKCIEVMILMKIEDVLEKSGEIEIEKEQQKDKEPGSQLMTQVTQPVVVFSKTFTEKSGLVASHHESVSSDQTRKKSYTLSNSELKLRGDHQTCDGNERHTSGHIRCSGILRQRWRDDSAQQDFVVEDKRLVQRATTGQTIIFFLYTHLLCHFSRCTSETTSRVKQRQLHISRQWLTLILISIIWRAAVLPAGNDTTRVSSASQRNFELSVSTLSTSGVPISMVASTCDPVTLNIPTGAEILVSSTNEQSFAREVFSKPTLTLSTSYQKSNEVSDCCFLKNIVVNSETKSSTLMPKSCGSQMYRNQTCKGGMCGSQTLQKPDGHKPDMQKSDVRRSKARKSVIMY